MITRLLTAGLAAAVLLYIGAGAARGGPPPPRSSPATASAGGHLVGRIEAELDDGARTVMVSAWYPTTVRGKAAYIPATGPIATARIAEQSAQWMHTPDAATAMAVATIPAVEGAPVDASLGRLAVVVMSPGLGTPRANLSSLAADLAAHGYIAVVLDHTGEGPAVQLASGRIVYGADVLPDDVGYMRARLEDRIADTRLVLDRLSTLPIVGVVADLERIAMVGHSYGGLTAVQLAATDPRIRTAVVLDGSAGWDGVAEAPALDRPVLLVGASGTPLHLSWDGFRDPQFQHVTLAGAGHYSVTDLCGFGGGAALCGTVSPGRATEITRGVVGAWLERQLRGTDGPRFEVPELKWQMA